MMPELFEALLKERDTKPKKAAFIGD